MAFFEVKNTEGVRPGSDGLWAVSEGTPNYRAWKAWLEVEFDKSYFPKTLTVWDDWPPTTPAGARRVAEAISAIRDESGWGKPVPRQPNPWDGMVSPETPKEEMR